MKPGAFVRAFGRDIVAGRTLYPYPAHPAHGGKGDVNDPANWHKR